MAHGNQVFTVFQDCQRSMSNHGKLVKRLIKIYKSIEFNQFWSEFYEVLKRILMVFEREPAFERCVEFATTFATTLKDQEAEDQEANPDDSQTVAKEIDEDIHRFTLKLFDFCLEHHKASGRSVRFRVCQIINKLLHKMGEEAQIDDELYDRIYECMLVRMRDIYPIIRIQAIFALARLQDPTDQDCPIINGYLFMLSTDPNSDVRRAVLTCIAASTKTLPALLERTRDQKDAVRRVTYQVLAEKVHIRALTIAQRVKVLETGLQDHVESVREACSTRLLQAWLRTFQGNILQLLECLDVETSVKTARLALKAIFTKTPAHELVSNFDLINDGLCIDIEKLSCESALYWRTLCEYLSSLGPKGEELLEKIFPLPTAFSAYLSKIVANMKSEKDLDAQLTNEFILQQLLELAALLDLSDQAGRCAVGKLIHDLLMSELATSNTIPILVDRYVQYQTDPLARVNTLCEIIAEIREPISQVEQSQDPEQQRQLEIKLAKVRVKLNQLREELEDSVAKQDFVKAAEIKTEVKQLDLERSALMQSALPRTQEVRTEKNDPVTLLRCMSIAASMMSSVYFRTIPPTIQTLMETLILPGVQNEDPAVRNLAVKALCLCCLLKADLAKKHLFLFVTISQLDVEAVKVTALRAIFDLLLIFGLSTFDLDTNENEKDKKDDDEADDKENNVSMDDGELDESGDSLGMPVKTPPERQKKSTESLMFILTELLNSKVSELRTVAAEGLAKLLVNDRISSPLLFSRLLLLWYNPITEDDTLLRHCLGTFFPMYAFASVTNQTLVEEAVMPTLRTLFNAPASSPLTEVDLNNVVDLLIQLTNPRHLLHREKLQLETTCHDSLAMRLCNEILSDPNSSDLRPLCRGLAALELTDNHPELRNISVLLETTLEKVKDKKCLRTLAKVHSSVKQLMKIEEADSFITSGEKAEEQAEQEGGAQSGEEDMETETSVESSTRLGESTTLNNRSQTESSLNVTSNGNRTALGQVQNNHPSSPQINQDPDLEDFTSKTRKPKAARTTKKKDRKQSDISLVEKSACEVENEVFASPAPPPSASSTTSSTSVGVRRSSRTVRSKPNQSVDQPPAETSSPARSLRTRSSRTRASTSRRN